MEFSIFFTADESVLYVPNYAETVSRRMKAKLINREYYAFNTRFRYTAKMLISRVIQRPH
jgi:hypothetical protein